MCGWGFLISLTFCIQNEADGILGTQQVGRTAAANPLPLLPLLGLLLKLGC